MRKRKMAAAFMAALMLTASLAGCGSSEKAESASDPSHGGAGKEEELLTIDMFCAPANYQGAVSYTHLGSAAAGVDRKCDRFSALAVDTLVAVIAVCDKKFCAGPPVCDLGICNLIDAPV